MTLTCADCDTSTREVAWSTQAERHLCLRCYARAVPATSIEPPIPRPRWPAAVATHDEHDECPAILAELADQGLRALIDPELELVRTECLRCQATDRDPLGLYLPLRVVPRGAITTFICNACGWERVDHAQRR